MKVQLEEAREAFRAEIEPAGARRVFENFKGRIAVVLPGGGARGAYEAGALLAFQDARLPTHVIAATSIGAINAASYAAHSDTLVGNADALVDAWLEVTPPAVGIEWTRYAWMLAGLIAASAGLGNLLYYQLSRRGFSVHLHHPAAAWLTLALAGAAVLLLYDHLPYVYHVFRRLVRRTSWHLDRRRLRLSVAANLLIGAFLVVGFESLHIHTEFRELIARHPAGAGLLVAALLALAAIQRRLVVWLGKALQGVLRLLARPGLFTNFERSRFLRRRIPSDRLRRSPIRVVIAATDLTAGAARFFTNAPTAQLAADAGVDAAFVAAEVVTADDLMSAVIASSAMPIAYEPMDLAGRSYGDGGIVATQPIRPAIRLGADVVILVLMEPPGSRHPRLNTFIDVGRRALDILTLQNFLADIKTLTDVNGLCQRAAAECGVRPEEVEIEFGARRFRYVRPFTIRPAAPLGSTILDFGSKTTGAAILQGYRDACAQIEVFREYAAQARFDRPRRLLRLAPEAKEPSA